MILVIGDSISAAHCIPSHLGWVCSLPNSHEVVNISSDGSTTTGALNRCGNSIVELRPSFVVIELGLNDRLKKIPIETTLANLNRMIDDAHSVGAKVLFLNFIPPTDKPAFAYDDETAIDVIAERDIDYVKLFLNDFKVRGELLPDGIHPNIAGQTTILNTVLTFIHKYDLCKK